MIVFPAIDLKAGQVVRLAEGDMDRATIYGDNPAAQAQLFAAAGASHLHVVDLDGAFAGQSVNGEAVAGIVAAFRRDIDAGILTEDDAYELVCDFFLACNSLYR